jgi:DNA-3-methyladenine glycosylase
MKPSLVQPVVGRRLAPADYADGNTPRIARFFLGNVLCVRAADGYAEGLITETEAYGGAEDAASHAYNGRRTARTEVMYAPGGAAYVYLCYGLHHMFNIITGPKDSPKAALVRAVKIVAGHEIVRRRRRGVAEKDWASGPGRVCTDRGSRGEGAPARNYRRSAHRHRLRGRLGPRAVAICVESFK